MFARFISLLVIVAPLAFALTLSPIQNATVGAQVDISWQANANDSLFSLYLVNRLQFHDTFAISNNVDPSRLSISVVIPGAVSPGDDFTIEAVNVSDINIVYATSAQFTIGAAVSVSGSSSTAPSTNTNTLSSSVSNSLLATSPSSSGFNSLTTTGTVTDTGSTASNTGSAASTPSNAAVSTRLALTNACGYAVLLLSAVAGAAVVAL